LGADAIERKAWVVNVTGIERFSRSRPSYEAAHALELGGELGDQSDNKSFQIDERSDQSIDAESEKLASAEAKDEREKLGLSRSAFFSKGGICEKRRGPGPETNATESDGEGPTEKKFTQKQLTYLRLSRR
jgi:hypothetical protein